MNTLVDVLVEEDDEEVIQLAKIVNESEKTYHIRFLTPCASGLYQYDKEPTEIDKECINGFYDSTDEQDAGFIHVEGGYQLATEYDDDYEPSESDEETDSEYESLCDSDEENLDE